MVTRYDVIWYWHPQALEWREAAISYGVAAVRAFGVVAHLGLRSIGPPEGPPPETDLQAARRGPR